MSDKEILEELRDQRTWWEKHLEEAEKKASEYKTQISKVNRLIFLLEIKIREGKQ